MSVDTILRDLDEECAQTVQIFKKDLQKVRTGRASTSLLEGIHVDYYGARTSLVHMGQISTPEPRLILIQVYDSTAVELVDKAIRSSDLNLNPSRDGSILRVSIPPLTEESRKEIVKHLNKIAEEIRVSIRNHRRDANDALKKTEKEGGVTQDDVKRGLEKVQKRTDHFIVEIEKLLKEKEAEILAV